MQASFIDASGGHDADERTAGDIVAGGPVFFFAKLLLRLQRVLRIE